MIFLVQYNPRERSVVLFRPYPDSELEVAEDDRLELELDVHRKGINHEVVLLEAESEMALQRTHGRYFYHADERLKSSNRDLIARTNS